MEFNLTLSGDDYFGKQYIDLSQHEDLIFDAFYQVSDQSTEGEVIAAVTFDMLTHNFSVSYANHAHSEWDMVVGGF